MSYFARRAGFFRNDMQRSCGALLGIVQGILADQELNDAEIGFLREWLRHNEAVAAAWPGNVVVAKVEEVLADGIVTEAERTHLLQVLQQLVGGTLEDLAQATHVSSLALDEVDIIVFDGRTFCLTGDFCFGPRAECAKVIRRYGGDVVDSVTRGLDYLIVGGLGSPEWKHGSFGLKIEKAMQYKSKGLPLKIVHEDPFAATVMAWIRQNR